MALDDKFFKSPISEEVASRINRRKKPKKRPKPWDLPNDGRTPLETTEAPIEDKSKQPSQYTKLKKKAVRSSSDDIIISETNTKHMRNISETKRESQGNISETNAKHMRNVNTCEVPKNKLKLETPETNAKHMRNICETKRESQRNISETNAKYMRNKIRNTSEVASISETNAKYMRNDSITEPVTKGVTYTKQLHSLSATETIFGLSEKEYAILRVITKICLEEGSLITPKITYGMIGAKVLCSSDTARVLVYRSIKKGIYEKRFSKPGRSGFIVLEIPQALYHGVLRNENNFVEQVNAKHMRNISVTEPVTEPVTSHSSSSSININNNSTTKLRTKNELPKEWSEIAIPNFLKDKRFGVSHIKQIYSTQKENLTAEQVQDSFNAFSYDLENNHVNCLTGPLNYFMSTVKVKGYEYISESLASAEAKEFEKLKKLATERAHRRKEAARMQIQSKVEDVCKGISDSEKIKLVQPRPGLFDLGSLPYNQLLFAEVEKIIMEKGVSYFDDKVKSDEFRSEIITLKSDL